MQYFFSHIIKCTWLTSEELHELLLIHAVEQALQLRVPEVAEVQAGWYSTSSRRPTVRYSTHQERIKPLKPTQNLRENHTLSCPVNCHTTEYSLVSVQLAC